LAIKNGKTIQKILQTSQAKPTTAKISLNKPQNSQFCPINMPLVASLSTDFKIFWDNAIKNKTKNIPLQPINTIAHYA
jgi:hypothetical protein